MSEAAPTRVRLVDDTVTTGGSFTAWTTMRNELVALRFQPPLAVPPLSNAWTVTSDSPQA